MERIGSNRTTSLIGGTEHEIDAKDHASALDQVFRYLPELFASGRDAWGTAEIRPGDVVWIPPNEKHWHGATPTTAMTHVAIQEALNGKPVEWMEKVSDEQYGGKN